MKRRLIYSAAFAFMGFAGAVLWPATAAHAAFAQANFPIEVFDAAHKVQAHQGYFDKTSKDETGHAVIKGGIDATNVTKFIAEIKTAYNSSDNEVHSGAAFIIMTMMGENAFTANRNSPSYNSNAIYNAWVVRVKEYDAASLIDWGANPNYPCGALNTYLQDGPNDVAWFAANNKFGSECNRKQPMIIFDTPGPGFYAIKRNCGNPVGPLKPLTPINANYSVTPTVVLPGSNTMDRGTVATPTTFTFNVSLRNTSTAPSLVGKAQLTNPNAAFFTSVAQSNFNDGSPANAYGPASLPGAPYVTAKNWTWNTKIIPRQTTISATVQIKVSPTATAGDYVFYLCYSRSTPTDLYDCDQETIRLTTQRTPNFQALGSDLHAGGSIGSNNCAASTGTVTAPGSTSQYIISAYGTSNAGSGGTVGNNALTAQNYLPVCRPDLVAKAVAERAGPYTTLAGGALTVDLGSLTAGTSETYYHSGGELKLKGTVGRKITIVQQGFVTIIGDIKVNNASYARTSLPSLGILATGDIRIDPAATTVEGYLFSDGTIDTCTPGATDLTCGTAQLNINGFIMGHDIALNRTGVPNSSGSQFSEVIRMTPQLYLNPPRFFDELGDETYLLEGQGELRPLF